MWRPAPTDGLVGHMWARSQGACRDEESWTDPGMKHAEDIADPRVIKALSHPLRVQILGLLDGEVRSPKELADELNEPLGNVSYHVRTLADLGLIELVKKVPRRGAIEHYYKAPGRHM